MKFCGICEEYHEENEIVLVSFGVEDGLRWMRFKCLRTGDEWEIWKRVNKKVQDV